jgi:hypothetical protein
MYVGVDRWMGGWYRADPGEWALRFVQGSIFAKTSSQIRFGTMNQLNLDS